MRDKVLGYLMSSREESEFMKHILGHFRGDPRCWVQHSVKLFEHSGLRGPEQALEGVLFPFKTQWQISHLKGIQNANMFLYCEATGT